MGHAGLQRKPAAPIRHRQGQYGDKAKTGRAVCGGDQVGALGHAANQVTALCAVTCGGEGQRDGLAQNANVLTRQSAPAMPDKNPASWRSDRGGRVDDQHGEIGFGGGKRLVETVKRATQGNLAGWRGGRSFGGQRAVDCHDQPQGGGAAGQRDD